MGIKENLILSNIIEDNQPGSLFCVPKGYKKLPPRLGPG